MCPWFGLRRPCVHLNQPPRTRSSTRSPICYICQFIFLQYLTVIHSSRDSLGHSLRFDKQWGLFEALTYACAISVRVALRLQTAGTSRQLQSYGCMGVTGQEVALEHRKSW
eukprot:INCI3968.1.p1 GENE.INCI3968.1~~INCI3968.1.p1  ORF type:complete len:111 (-),score=1.37 INCI3968.1:409-741(-)